MRKTIYRNATLFLILLLISFALLSSCAQLVNRGDKSIPNVSPEVEEAFNDAIDAIAVLNNATTARLEKEYKKQSGYPLCLNEGNAELGKPLNGTMCYGVFDKCIVVFYPTMLTVVSSKTIADEVFSYGSSFALYGYHDGVFYSLEEAYEKGFITKEEVAIAAECHRAIGWYNLLRSLYKRATTALKLPEEDMSKSIVEAFGDGGSSIEWLDLDNKEQFTLPHLRSYGDFNGCTVLLMTSQNEDENTKTVADRTFEAQMGVSLWGYYEGILYSLEEAYEKGFISQHDIGVALARHNDVELYIEKIIGN